MTVSGAKNVEGGLRSFETMKSAKVTQLKISKVGTDGVSRAGRKDGGTVIAGEKRGFFSSMFGRKRLDEKRAAHASACATRKSPAPKDWTELATQKESDLAFELTLLKPHFDTASAAVDKAENDILELVQSDNVTSTQVNDASAKLGAARKESFQLHREATALEEKRMVALGKLKGHEFAMAASQLDPGSVQKLKRGLEHLVKAGDFGQEIGFYAIRGRDNVTDFFALFPGIDLTSIKPMYVRDVRPKSEHLLRGIVEGMLQAIDNASAGTVAEQLGAELTPELRNGLKALGGLSMLPVPAPRDGLLFE